MNKILLSFICLAIDKFSYSARYNTHILQVIQDFYARKKYQIHIPEIP